MSKPKSEPTSKPAIDWREDPHAQAMMTILVTAAVAMYHKREKAKASAPKRAPAVKAPPPAMPDPATPRRKTKNKVATMDLSTS